MHVIALKKIKILRAGGLFVYVILFFVFQTGSKEKVNNMNAKVSHFWVNLHGIIRKTHPFPLYMIVHPL